MNTFEEILQLVQTLLPVIAEGASVFIHNKNSQKKLATVVGDTQTVAAVASALAQAQKSPGA